MHLRFNFEENFRHNYIFKQVNWAWEKAGVSRDDYVSGNTILM